MTRPRAPSTAHIRGHRAAASFASRRRSLRGRSDNLSVPRIGAGSEDDEKIIKERIARL